MIVFASHLDYGSESGKIELTAGLVNFNKLKGLKKTPQTVRITSKGVKYVWERGNKNVVYSFKCSFC